MNSFKSIFGVLTSMFKYHGTDHILCAWLGILLLKTNSNEWGWSLSGTAVTQEPIHFSKRANSNFPREVFLFHLNKDDYSYFSAGGDPN